MYSSYFNGFCQYATIRFAGRELVLIGQWNLFNYIIFTVTKDYCSQIEKERKKKQYEEVTILCEKNNLNAAKNVAIMMTHRLFSQARTLMFLFHAITGISGR